MVDRFRQAANFRDLAIGEDVSSTCNDPECGCFDEFIEGIRRALEAALNG